MVELEPLGSFRNKVRGQLLLGAEYESGEEGIAPLIDQVDLDSISEESGNDGRTAEDLQRIVQQKSLSRPNTSPRLRSRFIITYGPKSRIIPKSIRNRRY